MMFADNPQGWSAGGYHGLLWTRMSKYTYILSYRVLIDIFQILDNALNWKLNPVQKNAVYHGHRVTRTAELSQFHSFEVGKRARVGSSA